MKSAGNRGVVQSRLQVLHVHVFLVAPLGARHMAQPRADQHQGGISVRERPYHPRPSVDLSVQPLDHVVCADARPVLATSSQCFPQLVSLARSLCASVTVRTINIWAGQTVKGIYRCCQALTADISPRLAAQRGRYGFEVYYAEQFLSTDGMYGRRRT